MNICLKGLRTCIVCSLFFSIIFIACNEESNTSPYETSRGTVSGLRDSTVIDSLNRVALSFWSQSIDSLLAYSKQALALSTEINYTRGKIESYGLLGTAHYQMGEYRTSIHYHEQAIERATAVSDFISIAQGKCDIALSYNAIGVQDEALDHLFSAMQICEEHGLESVLAHVLNNLGMIYHYQHKVDQALTYYQRSRGVYESLGDSSKLTFILGNMAHIHLSKQEYTLAHEYYTISLSLAERFRNNKAIGNALLSLGNIYLERDNARDAMPYLLRSKDVLESIGEKTEYLRLMVNLSNGYAMLEDRQEAFRYARLGYDLALQQEQLWYIHESAEVLSRLYEEIGNHQLALDFFKTSKNALDSLNNVKNKEETVRLEEKSKFEREQREIRAEYDRQIDRRQLMLYLVSVLMVALAVIALLSLRYVRQKKQANAALEQANKSIEERSVMLQEADDFKSHLISLLAHDLRAPIASLKIVLHLFDQGHLSPDAIKKLMTASHTEIDLLSNVVDDLLLWVVGQSKYKKMEKMVLNLHSVVKDVLDLYRQRAIKKGIALRCDIAADIDVCADQEALKIILRNLVSNALKFCQAGDSTTIVARKDQESNVVTVRVVDTGVGMAEEVREQLFSLNTITLSGTDGEKGTGLGLLICQQYVSLNGGKLVVESKLGEGSTFWFNLASNCQ